MPACRLCNKTFARDADVRRHYSLDNRCKLLYKQALKQATEAAAAAAATTAGGSQTSNHDQPQNSAEPHDTFSHESAMEIDSTGSPQIVDTALPALQVQQPTDDNQESDPDAREPRIEEINEDNDENLQKESSRPWKHKYPADRYAGAPSQPNKMPTSFERIHDDQVLEGGDIWGPFEDEEDWELAKWLIKNVGHTAAESFLKLPIIAQKACPSFKNKKQYLDRIDQLPGGVEWQCVEMDVEGDIPDLEKDETGKSMRRENLELWFRDPVKCVEELIGNPAFRDLLHYKPERQYEDHEGKSQVINEMWTGNWWWDVQDKLPAGATVAPLILSSDKTLLSNFRGDNTAWPVYLTIGNIPKDTRREVSSRATVLLGYIPVAKFDCFSDALRSVFKYRLFHYCMELILGSLVEAGKDGVEMVCADGWLRRVWPILAAYVADYPEQCLVACCKENRCPICLVEPNERGSHRQHAKRERDETLFFLRRKQAGENDTAFTTHGFRNVPAPFWQNLPHADIFKAFTPDLLHQVHKGVFKDHLFKWCQEILSKSTVDELFRSAPSHHGLRHFKNGISHVSQWTGSEHKEMERVFLGLVASVPNINTDLLMAVRSLIDFIYYASLQSHTTKTLAALRQSLDMFHSKKDIFITLQGRVPAHFNIPKVHSLEHYEELIYLFGTTDGFNTETPERLHIDFAKHAFRATNRKDYIAQMTRWLERQEAVDRFATYLDWQSSRKSAAVADDDIQAEDYDDPKSVGEVEEESSVVVTRYSISKYPPPSSRHVAASFIMAPEGYQASCFLAALSSFLKQSSPDDLFQPYDFDVFGLWKQLVFKLPRIPQVGQRHKVNVVRATAPTGGTVVDNGRRRMIQDAHLDHALITTGETNDFTQNTALEGLRIARVHVIFQLPSNYPISVAEPLAYIEWYTQFRTPDPITGYYQITKSTRRRGPYAEIIPVSRIMDTHFVCSN